MRQYRQRLLVVLGLAGVATIAAYVITRGMQAASLAVDLDLPAASAWPRLGPGRFSDILGDSTHPAWLLLEEGYGTAHHRLCRLEGEGPQLGRARCRPLRMPLTEPRLLRGGEVPVVGSMEQGTFEIRKQAIAAIEPALVQQLPLTLFRAKGGGTLVFSNDVVGDDLVMRDTNGLRWTRLVQGQKQASGFIEGNFSGGLFEGTHRKDLFTCTSPSGGVAAAWKPQPEPNRDSKEGGTGTRGRGASDAPVPAPPPAPPEAATLVFLHDGTWSKAVNGPLPSGRSHEFALECEDNFARLTTVVKNQLVQLSCSPSGCSSQQTSIANIGEEPSFLEFCALGGRNLLVYLSRNALLFRMAAFDDLSIAREYRAFAQPNDGNTLEALAVRAPNAVYVVFGAGNEWRGLAIARNGQVVPVTLEDE